MIACFLVAFACLLGSTATVRLVGSFFLAATFAIGQWHTWKTGRIVIMQLGTFDRTERPVAFRVNAFLFLLAEVAMVLGTIVHAVRAPSW